MKGAWFDTRETGVRVFLSALSHDAIVLQPLAATIEKTQGERIETLAGLCRTIPNLLV